MQNDTLKQQLKTLDQDVLADRLAELAQQDDWLAQELDWLMLRHHPKRLAQNLKKQISSFRRSKRFVPRHQAYEVIYKLEQIMRVIAQDILPQNAEIAIDLIQRVFTLDQSLIERIDDSDGHLSDFYRELSSLWGQAWLERPEREVEQLASRICELLRHNHNGLRDHLIEASAKALGEQGLHALQYQIQAHSESFSHFELSSMKEAIADALDDVDQYIQIIRQRSAINQITVCEIAQRLIHHQRGEEAIDWLLHQPNDISLPDHPDQFDPERIKRCYEKRRNSLIQAYELTQRYELAQQLRWLLFQQTLAVPFYEGLINNQDEQQAARIRQQAFHYAYEHDQGSLMSRLHFLQEIQAWDAVNELIQKHHDALEGDIYPFYRPLSQTLAHQGYYLAACLIRRRLVEANLAHTQSKYYKYAVSDLKYSQIYADEVSDWHSFITHAQFVHQLQNQHGKKRAFWAQVNEAVMQ